MNENTIDINYADADSLAGLPGIGEVLAARIVEYRETVHPFEEIVELAAVPGISERMVRQIEDQIVVGQTPAAPDDAEGEGDDPIQVAETAVLDPKAAPSMESETEAAAADPAMPQPDPQAVPEEEEAEEMEPLILPDAAPEAGPERGRQQAPAPAPAAPGMAPSQRRGCVLILLGALLGAFVGTALTLAVLAGLNNGRLQFTQETSRLRGEVGTLQQSQAALQTQLSTAEALAAAGAQQLDNYQPVLEVLATRQGEMLMAQATAQAGLAGLGADLATMEAETAVLADRVENVAAAAEAFEVFLSGLRALLAELDVSGAVPLTGTVTVTPTPPLPGEVSTTTPGQVAPSSSPTPTLVPTRTPRPTATPIGQPTTES